MPFNKLHQPGAAHGGCGVMFIGINAVRALPAAHGYFHFGQGLEQGLAGALAYHRTRL